MGVHKRPTEMPMAIDVSSIQSHMCPHTSLGLGWDSLRWRPCLDALRLSLPAPSSGIPWTAATPLGRRWDSAGTRMGRPALVEMKVVEHAENTIVEARNALGAA